MTQEPLTTPMQPATLAHSDLLFFPLYTAMYTDNPAEIILHRLKSTGVSGTRGASFPGTQALW